MEFTALPIDRKMIDRHIQFTKCEYNKVITADEARAELESLKAKGCLLYEDCRSCPKFSKSCPL